MPGRGIGVAFILGIFMRIATVSAVVMLLLMYLSAAPWANTIDPKTGSGSFVNPIVDDHTVLIVLAVLLMLLEAGRTWGLGKIWESWSLVQSQPWLA
jgi:thiosulfate dehydrogenase (quinone) large subunit